MMINVRFTVKQQTLQRIGNYRLVQDSKNYVQLEFMFLDESWVGVIKTVTFVTKGGNAYAAIMEGNTIKVPEVCLMDSSFKVSIFGENLDKDIRITTNDIEIQLGESGYKPGEVPPDPMPSVYEDILKKCDDVANIAKDIEDRANAGEFNGKDGDDYVLTDADKAEIAGMVEVEEKTYELIETITLTEDLTAITRNAEPNGTPYSFKDIYILFIWANGAPSKKWIKLNLIAGGESTFVFRTYSYAEKSSRSWIRTIAHYGQRIFVMSDATTNLGYGEYWAQIPVATLGSDHPISNITISHEVGMPAGTKISIYGVRA